MGKRNLQNVSPLAERALRNRLFDSGIENPDEFVENATTDELVAAASAPTKERYTLTTEQLEVGKADLFKSGFSDAFTNLGAGFQQIIAGTDDSRLEEIKAWKDANTTRLTEITGSILAQEDMNLSKFMYGLGNGAASAAISSASLLIPGIGVAGAAAIGAASSYPMLYNSTIESALEAGYSTPDAVAYSHTMSAMLAAVESFSVATLGKMLKTPATAALVNKNLNRATTGLFRSSKAAVKEVAEDLVKAGSSASDDLLLGVYRSTNNGIKDRLIAGLGTAIKQGGNEGAEEVVQNYLERFGQYVADKKVDQGQFGTTLEDIASIKQAKEAFWDGLIGATVGAGMGAPAGAFKPIMNEGIYGTIDTFASKRGSAEAGVEALKSIVNNVEDATPEKIAEVNEQIDRVYNTYKKLGGTIKDKSIRRVVFHGLQEKERLAQKIQELNQEAAEIGRGVEQSELDGDIFTSGIAEIDKQISKAREELAYTSEWVKNLTTAYFEDRVSKNNAAKNNLTRDIEEVVSQSKSKETLTEIFKDNHELAKSELAKFVEGKRQIELKYDPLLAAETVSISEEDFLSVNEIDDATTYEVEIAEGRFMPVDIVRTSDGQFYRQHQADDGSISFIKVANTDYYNSRLSDHFDMKDGKDRVVEQILSGTPIEDLEGADKAIYEQFSEDIDGRVARQTEEREAESKVNAFNHFMHVTKNSRKKSLEDNRERLKSIVDKIDKNIAKNGSNEGLDALRASIMERILLAERAIGEIEDSGDVVPDEWLDEFSAQEQIIIDLETQRLSEAILAGKVNEVKKVVADLKSRFGDNESVQTIVAHAKESAKIRESFNLFFKDRNKQVAALLKEKDNYTQEEVIEAAKKDAVENPIETADEQIEELTAEEVEEDVEAAVEEELQDVEPEVVENEDQNDGEGTPIDTQEEVSQEPDGVGVEDVPQLPDDEAAKPVSPTDTETAELHRLVEEIEDTIDEPDGDFGSGDGVSAETETLDIGRQPENGDNIFIPNEAAASGVEFSIVNMVGAIPNRIRANGTRSQGKKVNHLADGAINAGKDPIHRENLGALSDKLKIGTYLSNIKSRLKSVGLETAVNRRGGSDRMKAFRYFAENPAELSAAVALFDEIDQALESQNKSKKNRGAGVLSKKGNEMSYTGINSEVHALGTDTRVDIKSYKDGQVTVLVYETNNPSNNVELTLTEEQFNSDFKGVRAQDFSTLFQSEKLKPSQYYPMTNNDTAYAEVKPNGKVRIKYSNGSVKNVTKDHPFYSKINFKVEIKDIAAFTKKVDADIREQKMAGTFRYPPVADNPKLQRFINSVAKVFVGVEIGVLSEQEWADAGYSNDASGLYNAKTRQVLLRDSKFDSSTVVHELGHVAGDVVRQYMPELYTQILEDLKGTKYEETVKSLYPELNEQETLDEAIAWAVQDKAAAMEKKSPLRRKIERVWRNIKRFFGFEGNIEGMTLEAFSDEVASKILKGETVDELLGESVGESTPGIGIRYQMYHEYNRKSNEASKMSGYSMSKFADDLGSIKALRGNTNANSIYRTLVAAYEPIMSNPWLRSKLRENKNFKTKKFRAVVDDFNGSREEFRKFVDELATGKVKNGYYRKLFVGSNYFTGGSVMKEARSIFDNTHVKVMENGQSSYAYVDGVAEMKTLEERVSDMINGKKGLDRFIARLALHPYMLRLTNARTLSWLMSGRSGVLSGVTDYMRKANNNSAIYQLKASERQTQILDELRQKYGVRKDSSHLLLSGKKKVSAIKNGENPTVSDVDVPIAVLIDLYATYKSQTEWHRRKGYEDWEKRSDVYFDGEDFGYRTRDKRPIDRGYQFELENFSNTILLNDEMLSDIKDLFENGGEYQREFDLVWGFYNSEAANSEFEILNKEFREVNGEDIERLDGYYYPVKAYGAAGSSTDRTVSSHSVEDIKQIHKRVGLSGRIRGGNAIFEMQKYVRGSSEYIQNAATVRSFKVYRDASINNVRTDDAKVRKVIDKMLNQAKAVKDNLNDPNGGVSDAAEEETLLGMPIVKMSAFMRNYAKSVFSFNFGTVARQPLALGSAFGLGVVRDSSLRRVSGNLTFNAFKSVFTAIPGLQEAIKSPVGGVFNVSDPQLMERMKNNPEFAVGAIRAFDPTENTKGIEIFLSEYDGFFNPKDAGSRREKAANIWRRMTSLVDQYGLEPMRQSDTATIASLYRAAEIDVEQDILEGRLKVDLNSKEAQDLIGQRATELVYATNNMYMLNDKTHLQRNASPFAKMVTLFSSQPQKIFNTLVQTYIAAAEQNFENEHLNKVMQKQLGIGVFSVSIASSLIGMAWGGLRHGFDREPEEYASAFVFDTIRNIAGLAPGVTSEVGIGVLSTVINPFYTSTVSGNAVIENYNDIIGGIKSSIDAATAEEAYLTERYKRDAARVLPGSIAKMLGVPYVFGGYLRNQILSERPGTLEEALGL